jgi:8-amino-7-oxononanoate synthase
MSFLKKILQRIEETGLYPECYSLAGPQNPMVKIGNDELLMFCSNNYLNLSTHPEVIVAAAEALYKFGTGSGGSRHISGTNEIHLQLEKDLSVLKGREDSLVFSSGYLANIAAVSAIANPLACVSKIVRSLVKEQKEETIVFSDELNHASIIDACKIAGRKCLQYKHADVHDLSEKLKTHSANEKVIITDGVFSMDGDIAPLPDIVEVGKRHNAFIIVDDAHATGILGENGSGTAEYFNLKKEVDLEVGTLNKVFGAIGGFISGDKDICKLLRVTSRPFIFSASMPASVAAGLSQSIRVIMSDRSFRDQLFSNIDYFQKLIPGTGIPVNTAFRTPIIPIIIGDEKKTIQISKELYKKGFFVTPVIWPAVAKGEARLRVTLMSHHTKKQIKLFVDTLDQLCKQINDQNDVTAKSHTHNRSQFRNRA